MGQENLMSVFDRVTQRIIADLEKGVRPWQKPWKGDNAAPRIVRPLRHTGEYYNGVNVLLLWDAAINNGYENPTWMTFKQAEDYGAHVRKGEKSSFVVYANSIVKTETDAKTGADIERKIPFLRGYNVFNVEQIEGLPEKFLAKPEPPISISAVARLENVDRFFKNTGVKILHGGGRAYYSEHKDFVQMPIIDAFIDSESYYATLGHEVVHWTKHKSRLEREFGVKTWGDENYAKEELVAEIGAAYLCADLGITPEIREDHAAYIDHWLHALKDDKKLIFTAAAHATRAVEFLKAKQPALTPSIAPESEKQESKIQISTRPENDIAQANKTLYVSEPMQVGNHQWRMLIGYNDMGSVGTRFEFQDESGAFWHEQRSWPNYNINKTYLGLPNGLNKLYARERPALIKFGLAPQPVPSKQNSFNF